MGGVWKITIDMTQRDMISEATSTFTRAGRTLEVIGHKWTEMAGCECPDGFVQLAVLNTCGTKVTAPIVSDQRAMTQHETQDLQHQQFSRSASAP